MADVSGDHPAQWPGRLFAAWLAIEAALERRRQRCLLLALDDRALKDFGVSRCDAEREAAKGWRP